MTGNRRNSALTDILGALLPLKVRDLDGEVAEKLEKIPSDLNEFGYDPFGMNPDAARPALTLSAFLYRHYFRAETVGLENFPEGRVMLVANHAGQLPFDGAMIAAALLLEAEPPRLARSLFEYWLPRVPWFNVVLNRNGQVVGTAENATALLEADECVLAFPEGVRGMNKPFAKRYQLQRFGKGFARLARQASAPVVPVAVVGSEEQQPGLTNLEGVAKKLGLPAFPITLGFPWLGPLGLLPLPVKYRIYFGEAIDVGSAGEARPIEEDVDRVRRAIEGLLDRGRKEREGVFF